MSTTTREFTSMHNLRPSNPWNEACRAFHTGARDRAHRHISEARQQTDHANTLLQATHRVNAHAVQAAHSTSPHAWHHTAPLFVPIPPDAAPLPLRLFAAEVSLTASYNHTLKLLHQCHKTSQLSSHILQPLRILLHHVQPVIESVTQTLSPDLSHQLSSVHHVSDAHAGDDDDTWECVVHEAQHLVLHIPILKTEVDGTWHSLHRWADAAAAAFDLLSAGELLLQRTYVATAAATAAHSLRDVAHTAATRIDTPTSEDAGQARTTWLQALSLSQSGDADGALTTILPAAQARLEATVDGGTRDDEDDDEDEEAMYLAAALLVQRGGDEASGKCVRLAGECASRAFRTADSLSLVARAARGRDAVRKWKVVLGMDERRAAGMWLTSRAFGRIGLYVQQADMLKVVEHLLTQEQHTSRAHNCPAHVIDLCGAPRARVTLDLVRAERGAALCVAGYVREGRDVLRSTMHDDGVRMALAWAMEDDGDGKDVQLGDRIGHGGAMTQWQRMGIVLARAEALMRAERPADAGDAMEDALRELAAHDGHGHACERLLRGVCYHNVAVVKMCSGEAAMADEWLAGAQTAFEKCGEDDGLAEFADDLALLSTLARCVSMWACGRRVDAAAHWVAKRGLQALGAVATDAAVAADAAVERDVQGHTQRIDGRVARCGLVTEVDDEVVRRMDAICVEVSHDARMWDGNDDVRRI